MKKTWKKFAVIGVVLCLMVTLCALFTACGGSKDNGLYTINVVDAGGNGVAGVTVKMCTLNDKGEEENCRMFVSDANGVINADLRTPEEDDDGNLVYKYTPANYHVTVLTVPSGYAATEYMEGVSQLYTKNFKNNSYTITLTAAE